MFVVLNNDAGHLNTFLVTLTGGFPRIFFKRFDRERDFAFFYFNDLDAHRVSHFKERTRVFDQAPIKLTNVNESLKPGLELHKNTKINRAGNLALNDVPNSVFINECKLLFLLVSGTLGENKFSLPRVSGDDTHRECVTDEFFKLAKDFVFVPVSDSRVMCGGKL